MKKLSRLFIILAAMIALPMGQAVAQGEPEVRVIVPDVPGGVIVSNCYRAVGRIYDGYTFDFCLKQRATYTVRGNGVRCDGRMTWNVDGIWVNAKLRKTSCGNGVAWSADSLSCRPSIILGIIAGLLNAERPLLDNLACDYTPAKGTGQKKISFIAHRR